MNAIDYSVFYYTYSTIAQTLAGAFGFVAAVSVYQMQFLMNAAYQNQDRMAENMNTFSGRIPAEDREGVMQMHFALLKIHSAQMIALQSALFRSLVWVGSTVVACFILMPLTNSATVLGRSGIAWTCLSLTVIAAIVSLATFYPIVMQFKLKSLEAP